MVHLFLGDDLASKDARIAEIKHICFKGSADATAFDFDNLDAAQLPADRLKQAFLTLPAVAGRRLVVLRNVHKIKSADAKVLVDFCRRPAKHCEVILESSEIDFKGDLQELKGLASTGVLSRPKPPSVFDMTRLITSGRSGEALKMLNGFYQADVHPLSIMGALVWYWGKEGKARGKETFKQGLKALEEADLNIKRSRLEPEYAVEKLVVELGRLLRR